MTDLYAQPIIRKTISLNITLYIHTGMYLQYFQRCLLPTSSIPLLPFTTEEKSPLPPRNVRQGREIFPPPPPSALSESLFSGWGSSSRQDRSPRKTMGSGRRRSPLDGSAPIRTRTYSLLRIIEGQFGSRQNFK